MKNKIIGISIILALAFAGANIYKEIESATNFERLVLGASNFGTDPNPTADITLQNGAYITNTTSGTLGLSAVTLNASATICDTNAFTTTATEDTVTISGALVGDKYIVSGRYTAGVDQQDVLEWEALSGKLVVHRLASGESALKYSWLRIK